MKIQALELSIEQKEKLLEMSKKLFPEYKTVNYTTGDIALSKKDYISTEQFDNQLGDNGVITFIPWFEFCFTYLAKKMNLYDDGDLLYECVETDNHHPIDYIYDQFKNN